ncbi:MAG TPA: hypothetical protein VHJ82_05505 [Actinomycetota bacterium]|nr:hypothetical protein [Actinomycetota bacterium]
MPERQRENIVPLGVEPIAEEQPPPTPMGRAHGWGTMGMALCALIGSVALVSLITIRWPAETGRIPKIVIAFSVVGFMICAALAAAGAAGATYARRDASAPADSKAPD